MWTSIRKILTKSSFLNKIHLENNPAVFRLGVVLTVDKIDTIKKLLKEISDNKEVSIQYLDYNMNFFNNLSQFDGLFLCYDMNNTSTRSIIQRVKETISYSYFLIGFKSDLIVQIHDHIITTSKHIQLLKERLYRANSSLRNKNEGIIDIIDQILNTTDDEYHHITIFLTVFRKFMKPFDLLKILITKFEFDLINQSEYYYSKRTSAKFILPTLRQERISYFFNIWLSNYWNDFNDSGTFRTLLEFTKRISVYSELNSIYRILSPFTLKEQEIQKRKKDSGYSDSFEWYPNIQLLQQEEELVNSNDILELNVMPASFARQLTYIDMELFKKVESHDFLYYVDRIDVNNPLMSIVEHFNHVSGWIASLIIHQENFEKRVRTFEYCMQIAIELSHLNNFNSLMAVLGGINSAAILRLKQTRFHIQCHNATLYKQFLNLENLMSSERSFYNYRKKLNVQSYGIPYFGIHQQDLLSLNEANKDYLMNGKIHWKKFELIGDCILKVMKFQSASSCSGDIVPESLILSFIREKSFLLTEDERYQRSIEIEPRLANPILLF